MSDALLIEPVSSVMRQKIVTLMSPLNACSDQLYAPASNITTGFVR